MKINFLINSLSEGKGIPNRVAAMASELSELNNQVSVLTLDKAGRKLPGRVTVAEPKLIGRQKLPFRFVDSNIMALKKLSAVSIARELGKLSPKFVFVDFTPLDKYANSLKSKSGHKVIYTYHGIADPDMYEGEEKQKRIIARENILKEAKKADYVTAVSEYTKEELNRAGINSVVVPNGVDLDFFKPGHTLANFTKDKPVVVYVGRYTEHKGVLNLLKSFKMAKESVTGAVLYMFARHESPKYVEQIKEYIKKNRLEGSVFMFREIFGEMLPYIYSMGDVFASGALDETFGMTFVEAAACGVPSIAFASKSIPEVVEHGKTGLLAKPGDIESMAENMVTLLSDKKLRDEYSNNAVLFAKKYDWKIIAKNLNNILMSLDN